MSDQQIGKKEMEFDELMPFLDAYELSTAEVLSIVKAGEEPDFVCARENGDFVGIELTKVMRGPATAWWEGILERKEHMECDEALERMDFLIERKNTARTRRYSLHVRETILVLQLIDRPLDGLARYLEGLQDDFSSPDDLYPGRPDLVRDHSMQLSSGWWLGTNHSRASINRIIEMACNVGHLRYGKDLRAELGK